MLDFCLTFTERHAKSIPGTDLSLVCLESPTQRFLISSETSPQWCLEVFLSSSGSLDQLGNRVQEHKRGGLEIYVGYARDGAGRPIRSIETFDPKEASDYRGDFLYISLTPAGVTKIIKSPVCSAPLYIANDGGRQALASRASLAFLAINGDKKPNASPEFLRWAATYGIGCNAASVLDGVAHVQINQSVETGPWGMRLTAPDPAFLHDPELRELYARDRKQYWDDAFEHLLSSAAVINFSEAPIEFPLSGGKDSRLLLALTKKCMDPDRPLRVYTNGPEMSPDVRSAKLVCEALGLSHTTRDNTAAEAGRAPSINDHLATHAHITEGEMSPVDLTWGFGKHKTVQPFGQDASCLRNIARLDDIVDRQSVRRWMAMHIGYGDRCGIFKAGQASKSMTEVNEFIDASLQAGLPAGDIPNLHRTIFRLGRWAARTWTFNNNRGFAPYPFVDFDVFRYTFNSGPASRLNEEFHFEMLSRLDKKLVAMPFAIQKWPAETLASSGIKASEPLAWPTEQFRTRALPRFEALIRNFELLRTFILSHEGPATSQIIDRDRFSRVDLSTLHESSYQCFWQVVQIALIENVSELSVLRSGIRATELGLPNLD